MASWLSLWHVPCVRQLQCMSKVCLLGIGLYVLFNQCKPGKPGTAIALEADRRKVVFSRVGKPEDVLCLCLPLGCVS